MTTALPGKMLQNKTVIPMKGEIQKGSRYRGSGTMPELNAANRTLLRGDNLPFLRGLNSDSVDLIATDPPFNKNRDFHATPGQPVGRGPLSRPLVLAGGCATGLA